MLFQQSYDVTPQLAGDIESLKSEVQRVHPIKRYGTPEDVAGLVNWLAVDGSKVRFRTIVGFGWWIDTAQVQQMRL